MTTIPQKVEVHWGKNHKKQHVIQYRKRFDCANLLSPLKSNHCRLHHSTVYNRAKTVAKHFSIKFRVLECFGMCDKDAPKMLSDHDVFTRHMTSHAPLSKIIVHYREIPSMFSPLS